MVELVLVKKPLPQNPAIEVLVPNYKEPILPVNHGGFGWYGLQAYNEQGQLMCHECGSFFDELGNHIRKHNLNSSSYREKYGLLKKKKLVSESAHNRMRLAVLRNPARCQRISQLGKQTSAKHGKLSVEKRVKRPLEFFNQHDSCPNQTLRKLSTFAKKYGPTITAPQVSACDVSLVRQLQKWHGSFNKAKQILRLSICPQGFGKKPKFGKLLILEDMCRYYSLNNRWPMAKDYLTHKMFCSYDQLYYYGKIKSLLLEAQQLRETQETNKDKGERAIERAKGELILQTSHARR